MTIRFSSEPSNRARMILAYGEGSLGKTTFVLGAPDPVLLSLEGGEEPLRERGVCKPINLTLPDGTRVPRTWDAAIGMLSDYRDMPPAKRPGKWLVIDGVTRLWELCVVHVLSKNSWSSLSDPGYGKGERAAFDAFKHFLYLIDDVCNQGTGIAMTAHCSLAKDKNPGSPTEDAGIFVPALQCVNNADASRALAHMCDVRLFFTREAFVTGVGADPKKPSKYVSLGTGRIVARTRKGHGYLAGTRYPDVPDPIELSVDPSESWKRFWDAALETADTIRSQCQAMLPRCPEEWTDAKGGKHQKPELVEALKSNELAILRAIRTRLNELCKKENDNE